MTNREFYNAIINHEVNDEIIAMAKAEIEKLDARNEKRRNTLTKEQKANEEVKGAIVEFIGDKSEVVASDIAKSLDLSTQKVSALCKQMVDNGVLAVSEVKVKGKGAVKGYRKA
jgi:predicted transcriptional regulator